MRKQLKFSAFGKILQEKSVKASETAEIFKLEMPKNHIGFLYYLANNHHPLELNIDGEKTDIKGIIAPIDAPKVFDPPFLIKEFIKVTANNTTNKTKKIGFYADGITHSLLTVSEEVFINEIKDKIKNQSPIKTEEKRPQHPHIINHSLNNADTWYEIKLPKKGVKAWSLRCRENNDINYCYEPSGSTYKTLSSGGEISEDTAPEGIHAIYVRCATANVTIEMELWREV